MKRSRLQRKTALRRTGMRRKPGSTKYSRRQRDLPRMSWVRQRPCSVGHGGGPLCADLWQGPRPDRCIGPVEAHHAGARGLGQKAPDDTTIPLCRHHHRGVTDRSGCFAGWPPYAVKAWELAVIDHCRSVYAGLVGVAGSDAMDVPF